MSRIFVTGDTHGDIDFHKLNSKNFPIGKTLTKDDYVIICGDVGITWYGNKKDRYLQEWYENRPWTTLFVDGNHENFDVLEQYPVEFWNGGKVHKITPSVIHLMRGQVFTINGKRFFTMGGAKSQDKHLRTEGVSWWPREEIDYFDFEEANKNLDKVDNKVDYVITHCAPSSISDYIGGGFYKHDDSTNYLEFIRTNISFHYWFCGHYHRDIDIGRGYNILYKDIIELNMALEELN